MKNTPQPLPLSSPCPTLPVHGPNRRLPSALARFILVAALTPVGLRAQASVPGSPTSALKPDVVELSPFTITGEKDTGYYAQNTLSGSRMRTNLADLGASISVVTKAQLEDFASVDLNDAFRYEVNTEGSGTYTPAVQAARADGLLDVNAGGTQGGSVSSFTNATANRVRGIGVPSAAINYFPSIAAVPPDVYNTENIEVSRGPNSMLFGLGSPAGIANQSTMQAALRKNSNRVQLRSDDRGSYRSSLSFNRVLVPDRLALAGALLYDNRQFQRKPSYDVTDRQYVAVKYQPFSGTTIRVNYEHFGNRNRRPNTISPIDFITQWNLAGRPIYDALTKRFTLLSNGRTYGPYISSSASPYAQQVRDAIIALPGYNPALRGTSATTFGGTDTTFTFYNGQAIYGTPALFPTQSLSVPNPAASVLYVPGVSQINQGRAAMQIGNGRLQNWYLPLYNTTYTTAYAIPGAGGTPAPPNVNNPISNIWNNPASADVYDRNTFASTGWTNNSFLNNVGNFRYPGVTDRSIYDWKKINAVESNYGSQRNQTYQIDVDQRLTGNLFFNGGWMRQDYRISSNYTVGQLNAAVLRIDQNKYLPNGQPNPYVGLPFVQDIDPDRFINSQVDDHFRGMLAWTPDLTRRKSWLRWLGRHQILGLWSRDESMALAERQRLSYVAAGSPSAAVRFVANPNNNADGSRTGWNFGGATQRLYYLANPGDPAGKVTRASGEWNPNTFNGDIQVYNYLNNSFENANVTEQYMVGVTSPVRSQRTLQSLSGGITSYLWRERLVTNFGARLDRFKARTTTDGLITLPNGTVIPALTPQQKFQANGYFDYSSIWNRFNAWSRATGRTKTGGAVLTPFRNWQSIESRANGGTWDIVRSFGLVYNWSNNFDAPAGAQIDAFGRPLPNPQGVGRDVGFQFAALNDKLFVRVTWFQASSQNQRTAVGAALGRLTAQVPLATPDAAPASVDGLFKAWARTIAKINLGVDPTIDNPGPSFSPQQELEIQTAAARIWGLPYTYYENLPGAITTTGDAVAKGMEIQLNYNTDHWRNRLTFGQQVTRNSNVLKQFDAWFANRNPAWQAATATQFLLPQYRHLASYTTASGVQVNLQNFLASYGYTSTVRQNNPSGGQSVQDWINVNLIPQVQLNKDLNGQQAPGQRKFRAAYNTGYDFSSGRLKGWGVGGAQRWEDKSVIGYYGKSSRGNPANPNLIDISDVTRPIYDQANFYTDLFARYRTRAWNDRVGLTLQLNVENVFEDGHLQPVGVNYNGAPYGFRIIDSRKFSLTATFDF